MTSDQFARIVRQAATGQQGFTVRAGFSDTLSEHDGAEIPTDHGLYRVAVTGPKVALVTKVDDDE